MDFLFQLTDEEVRAAAGGNQQFLFDSKGQYNGAAMESYLFFAIALKQPHYTRTQLAAITRAVNRFASLPAATLLTSRSGLLPTTGKQPADNEDGFGRLDWLVIMQRQASEKSRRRE